MKVRSSTHQSYQERILRALIYIQNHPQKKLSLDELAAVAEFSPYHFHRIFRSIVGETVKEHVRRLRLEQAARSLKLSDEPVTNIAFQTGYETHESFSRAFKAMFDVSPSTFRKRSRDEEDTSDPRSLQHLEKLRILSLVEESDAPVIIEERKPLRVAFIRQIGPYEKSIEQRNAALNEIRECAGSENAEDIIGIPLDDPSITPEEKLRYDWCLPAKDEFQPTGRIGVQTIEGGEYATITHSGDFSTLEDTILTLFGDWFPLSNRDARSAPMFIQYSVSQAGNIHVYVPLKPTNHF